MGTAVVCLCAVTIFLWLIEVFSPFCSMMLVPQREWKIGIACLFLLADESHPKYMCSDYLRFKRQVKKMDMLWKLLEAHHFVVALCLDFELSIFFLGKFE